MICPGLRVGAYGVNLMRIMYHWQGTCDKKRVILGVHFYIHGVQFMYG